MNKWYKNWNSQNFGYFLAATTKQTHYVKILQSPCQFPKNQEKTQLFGAGLFKESHVYINVPRAPAIDLWTVLGDYAPDSNLEKYILFIQCKHSVQDSKLYRKDIVMTYLETEKLWNKLRTYKFASIEGINIQKMDWQLVVVSNRPISTDAEPRKSKKEQKLSQKKQQLLDAYNQLTEVQRTTIFNKCIIYDNTNVHHLLTIFNDHICERGRLKMKDEDKNKNLIEDA